MRDRPTETGCAPATEPTSEMIEAGADVLLGEFVEPFSLSVRDLAGEVYRAMERCRASSESATSEMRASEA